MALLQLWEDSFVAGRCPTCDDHVHSARSVHSGTMMSFDNPLKVVRTETLTSTPPRAQSRSWTATPRCVTSSPAEGGREPTLRRARTAVVRRYTDEEAQKAAAEFNQYQMGGRSLSVNEARPRPTFSGGRGGCGGDRGGGGGGREPR